MADRIQIGQLPVDVVDMAGTLDAIEDLVQAGNGGTVFTPNVDHIMVAEKNERFRQAYRRVSLSLVDGVPVLWAARLLGQPLPEKVSGSDLVIPLLARAAQRHWRVFLLGGAPGAGERASARLREQFPELKVVGVDAPRVDLAAPRDERLALAQRVAATRPDLVLVGFGAPKQEIFCDETLDAFKPAVLVCVGASIDFIAGVTRRAPAWMSRCGLEWTYRLAQEPRRLAARYLLRDTQFLFVVLKQWAAR